ncbi:amidase [Saccharomonospora sp. NPDC046836]|uniref:amidase n=1 Tax=Saccharomonospora sp. NPDC046836 TaxID=3156921 RepID=UPI0033F2F979
MTGERLRDIAGTAAALRSGAVTVPSLVEEALERASAAAHLVPFVTVHEEQARAAARGLQLLLDNGYDLGPLHGIPVSVKDNIAEAGRPNRAGSTVLGAEPAGTDAPVLGALRRAGALIVGRTTMHELAWGGTTDNPHDGTCRNPWDPDRIPAGSSGGSAVAVSVGASLAALGTDTGGSVRLPAAATGLTGLRPTIGRVPTGGVVPLAWTMDTVGPLAPRSADCAAVYHAITGQAAPARPPSLRGLRVGVVENYTLTGLEAGVERAVRRLLTTLTEQGARVEEVRLPGLDVLVDAQIVVDACEPSAVHARGIREHPERFGVDVRAQLEAGHVFSGVEYVQAQRYRAHLASMVSALWAELDVLVTPTVPFTAPRSGQRVITLNGRDEDVLVANMRFTALPSMAGLPALSLPCGFDDAGLPVGAQLIGPAWSEDTLLAVGEGIQRVTDHHGRRPPHGGW